MNQRELPPFAPIFPLPEVVFFPGVVMPLHVFEPRFRAMTADALAADPAGGGGLIVLALLQPGWEEDYAGTPPVHSIATAGEITHAERLDDGRYFLTLRGIQRVRLPGEESLTVGGYRLARINPAPESVSGLDSPAAADELTRLLADFAEWNSSVQIAADPKLLVNQPEYRPTLLNTLAFHLGVPPAVRQELLEESDLGQRLSRVQAIVHRGLAEKRAVSAFRHLTPDDPRMN